MRQLRRAASAGPHPPCDAAEWAGWLPEGAGMHHCGWDKVMCDREGHVVRLTMSTAAKRKQRAGGSPSAEPDAAAGTGGGNPSGDAGPAAPSEAGSPHGLLLPELARLPRLHTLTHELCSLVNSSLPAEWGLPGAFPALVK